MLGNLDSEGALRIDNVGIDLLGVLGLRWGLGHSLCIPCVLAFGFKVEDKRRGDGSFSQETMWGRGGIKGHTMSLPSLVLAVDIIGSTHPGLELVVELAIGVRVEVVAVVGEVGTWCSIVVVIVVVVEVADVEGR
jgi:hypothetical protein